MRKFVKIPLAILGTLVLVFALFLFGLKRLLDQSTVKSLVIEKIEHVMNLKVNYSEIDTVLFPFPGIELKEIQITDEGKKVVLLNDLLVEFDLGRIFQKEFQIRSIQVSGGEVYVERAEDGSFPIASKFKSDAEEIEEGREKVEEGPSALFQYLPKAITVRNLKVFYSDLSYPITYELNLKEFELAIHKADLAVDLSMLVEVNQNPISLVTQMNLTEDVWTLDAIKFKVNVVGKQFQLNKLIDLVQIYPKGDMKEAALDLDFTIEKNSKKSVQMKVSNFAFSGVKTKKGEPFPEISLNTSLGLNLQDQKLNLNEFSFLIGDRLHLTAQAELIRDLAQTSTLTLRSDRLDIDKNIPYLKFLANPDLTKSVLFQKKTKIEPKSVVSESKQTLSPRLGLTLDLKKLTVAGNQISYLKGPLDLKENQLFFKNIEMGIFDGKANLNGQLNLVSKRLKLDAKLAGIQVEKAVASATKDKLLKGKLNSDVAIDMNLNQTGGLKLKSVFHIRNGQLLGYANFIKPVAEVGKLFNFSGGKGESTEFESIDGSINLSNHQVQLHTFEMKGVGLNATGSGVYNEGGKIDMKFTVALAGVVGRAVKLPIIYRGYYGKNFAFIDPVWLATVYTGTMLGGPLGTVLGSMAGSQASERVDQSLSSVKNTFSDIKGFFFDEKKEVNSKK